jgi:hypothetical protein
MSPNRSIARTQGASFRGCAKARIERHRERRHGRPLSIGEHRTSFLRRFKALLSFCPVVDPQIDR